MIDGGERCRCAAPPPPLPAPHHFPPPADCCLLLISRICLDFLKQRILADIVLPRTRDSKLCGQGRRRVFAWGRMEPQCRRLR